MIFKKRKGQMRGINELTPLALALVSLAIVVSVGAVILTNLQPVGYDSLEVANETFNATSNPYNHTVDKSTDGGFVEITAVTCYNSTAQSTEITCSIEDSSSGIVSVETAVDADLESIKYTWTDSDTSSVSILSEGISSLQTFADFFVVIIVIGIAAVIFILLRMVRRSGAGVSA